MAIQYRKLTEKELDIFIEMRICQLREQAPCVSHGLQIHHQGRKGYIMSITTWQ